MPLEIRELIIKTKVTSKKEDTSSAGKGTINQTQINEIAEKVFEILKEKSER